MNLTARRIDVTEAEYHADPCETPSLSSSLAKVLLAKSPLHAWHQHPRLGAGKREEKAVFDKGQLAHKLLLGKGREIAIIEADDFRSKSAREARDQAYSDNKIPALASVFENATKAAEAWTRRLAEKDIVLSGESEIQIVYQTLTNRGPIWVRIMVDHIIRGPRSLVAYDFKTTQSAHPRACVNSIVKYAYDVQQAAYVQGLALWAPECARDLEFAFLFGEFAAPYDITPGRLDDALREHGEEGWNRAVVEFGEHTASSQAWPGYTNGMITFEAPGWLVGGGSPEIGFEGETTDD